MPGVFKAAIGATQKRVIAAGAVFVVPGHVFWIACTPSGSNGTWELTDDLNGSTDVIYEHWDTDKHSDHIDFNPPLEFAVGCYVKTFDNMTSLVFCYE